MSAFMVIITFVFAFTMIMLLCLVTCLLCILGTCVHADWMHHKNHKQTNFLFLMYDDLRPELSIYGRKHVISPNFERLAKRSVVFDNNYVQIAVCNPSRDSILTGLRPDTTGTYGFQHSSDPHNTIGHQLVKSNYATAAYGKLRHWDGDDKKVWSHESWQGGWYEYQNLEWSFMNASVQPDAVRTEEEFRDHIMTTKAIKGLRDLSRIYTDTGKHFMVAVGFKLPHVTLHVPQKYYDMYADLDMSNVANMTENDLSFPRTTVPAVSYRCCAENDFKYMHAGGTKRAIRQQNIENINEPVPMEAYNEIMRGYCAGVSFLDAQLGRLLDEMDSLGLWETTTIVLSADHGMHNGEKGMWEKWTLFDEATHTPLVIYHPLSPFKGQHYRPVVEGIDIFPTIVDLLQAPFDVKKHCPDREHMIQSCTPLQGKSLAPVVLGQYWDESIKKRNVMTSGHNGREKRLWPQPLTGLYSGSSDSASSNSNREKPSSFQSAAAVPKEKTAAKGVGAGVDVGSVAAMLRSEQQNQQRQRGRGLRVNQEVELENPVPDPTIGTSLGLGGGGEGTGGSSSSSNSNSKNHHPHHRGRKQKGGSSSSSGSTSGLSGLSENVSQGMASLWQSITGGGAGGAGVNSSKVNKTSPFVAAIDINSITFPHDFALTQFWRCLPKREYNKINMDMRGNGLLLDRKVRQPPVWYDCNTDERNWNSDSEKGGMKLLNQHNLMLMGYSLRTLEWRYTAWIDFNSSSLRPIPHPLNSYVPLFEELYDHRGNILTDQPLGDFTHGELVNLATAETRFPAPVPAPSSAGSAAASQHEDEIESLRTTIAGFRRRLLMFLERRMIYAGRH